jgi:hypothetical protein
MSNKSTERNYSGNSDGQNRENYLSRLRHLTNGYSKYLRHKKIILIADANGELMKFPLRRKEDDWVELGPHNERRPKKRKFFPGRFSLATGESLDGFKGWRLVPYTDENLEAAKVYARARKYRAACRRLPAALRPEYAAILTRSNCSDRRPTRELEHYVGLYLKMSQSDRRGLLGMMEMDSQPLRSEGKRGI